MSKRWSHGRAVDVLRLALGRQIEALDHLVPAERVEAARPTLVFKTIRKWQRRDSLRVVGLSTEEGNPPLTICIGQRLEHNRVDDRIDGSRRPYANGEREGREQRYRLGTLPGLPRLSQDCQHNGRSFQLSEWFVARLVS